MRRYPVTWRNSPSDWESAEKLGFRVGEEDMYERDEIGIGIRIREEKRNPKLRFIWRFL